MHPGRHSNISNVYKRLKTLAEIRHKTCDCKNGIRFPIRDGRNCKKMTLSFICSSKPVDRPYLWVMERYCLECGEKLSGRSDKRFCCDSCRSNWHNSKVNRNDSYVRQVNGILHKNRRILQQYYESGRRRIGRHELFGASFNPDFYTSCSKWPLRRFYRCYDMSYTILPNGGIYILKAKKTSYKAEE